MAQLAAAGVRPDLSAGYTAAQLAAAGVRPDLSAGYSAAQLAAAGIRPMPQSVPQPMQALNSQPVPSGLHALAGAHPGTTGRHDGDVSAMLSGASVPALLPTGMVAMLPGAVTTAPHPHEFSGITLTTRQLVATLTMTSLLSGIIGALIALLVLQRAHQPTEMGLVIPANGGVGSETAGPGPESPPAVKPGPGAATSTSPRPVSSPTGAVNPVAVATNSGKNSASGLVDTLVLKRSGVTLPPLRLLSVLPVGVPHQSQWTRPAGSPAALARPPSVPAPGPKPPVSPPATATPAVKKPAADTPPKPGAKPAAGGATNLKNPF